MSFECTQTINQSKQTVCIAGVLQYFPTEYNTQKSQHEKQHEKENHSIGQ